MLTTDVEGGGAPRRSARPTVTRAGDRFAVVSDVPDRAAYLDLLAGRPGTVIVRPSTADAPDREPPQVRALREAIEAHRRARAEVDAAAAAAAAARAEHERARARRHAAEEAIRAGLAQLAAIEVRTLSEPEVRRRLERQRAELTQCESECERARAALADRRRAATAALAAAAHEIERLQADQDRLRAQGSEAPPDLADVARALARYEAAIAAGPSADALRLAEEWTEVNATIAALEAERPPPVSDRMLAIAQEQVAAARAELERARAELLSVSDEVRRVIDERHAAVEAASAAVRNGARDASARLAAARREERAALAAAGFSSHAEYLLAVDAGDPAGRLRIWSAERALTQAEEDLGRVLRTREPDPRLAAAIERRHALRDHAVAMLGTDVGDDLAASLRALPAADPGALGALADALGQAGVAVPEADRVLPLDEQARRLLDSHATALAEMRARKDRLARIDAELTAARANLARVHDDVGTALRTAEAHAEACERRRLDLAAAVTALEQSLDDRLTDAVDAGAADAADELRARIDALRRALDASVADDAALAAAEQREAAAAAALARAHADLAARLRFAEPGGEQRDPSKVLARLEARLAGSRATATDLDAMFAEVEALATAPNRPSTIVVDLPMTLEERMAGSHARRLADLARAVRIVWVAV